VMRTVEELEIAGISGMSIEDTVLPQAFGAAGKPGLISVEEGVGKLRAALEARTDKSMIIAGRTSAPQFSSIADAIARGKAYAATGVDAMFYVGVKTRADLDAIAAEIKIPLILGGSSPDLLDRDYLASRGVRVALQGHQPIQAAVRAIHATMQALRDGTPPAKLEGLASAELMKIATHGDDYERWSKTFLS
jgi:oxaloacetate decarboxylase